MNVSIHKTNRTDFHQTENLTREVFWNLYESGASEHLVLHNLRKSENYIKELDLVAKYKGEIIGHIIASKAKICSEDGAEHSVLCIGPVSVIPSMQGKSTGTKLINCSIKIAQELGYPGIILFGDPNYYKRFGFTNAQKYGITTKDGKNFDPFMALELTPGSLKNVKGKFFDDKAYTVNEEELAEYEKSFPKKEKGKAKINIEMFL